MPKLLVQNVSKSYGHNHIFTRLNFSVSSRESLAISAPSGNGKTTLLSIAGTLLKPDTGTVYFDDLDVYSLDDKNLALFRSERIGFMFQHAQLVGSYRLIENVLLPSYFSNISKNDAQNRAEMLLEKLNLTEKKYHYPHQLSMGQKRRTALIRALILNPTILIADEPTNDLDEANSQIVCDLLFQHVMQGNILLIASHDQKLLKRCSKVLEL